jgi:ferredoxin
VEFNVTFELPDGSSRVVRCGAEEHILDAARRHGLRLPSSCEQGWDLACAVQVLSGAWDNGDARRYYPQDREAGFALICTARPRSDLHVRTHQRSAMQRHRAAHGLPAPRGDWGEAASPAAPSRSA